MKQQKEQPIFQSTALFSVISIDFRSDSRFRERAYFMHPDMAAHQ